MELFSLHGSEMFIVRPHPPCLAKVAARCSVRGQHVGDHLGVAASNAPVQFTGMVLVRIRDGKFVEAWNNFDFMSMNRQIGAV